MSSQRIPPIQGLLAFEALARLRSVVQASAELHVTPSAVSHRIRQLETRLGFRLFERADFQLSGDGAAYLRRVRDALAVLRDQPAADVTAAATRLRVAVPPTFSRELLLPRLAGFRQIYPEIELTLQVMIPLLNVTAADADIEIRFGAGPFADRESALLQTDRVSPVCSPALLAELGGSVRVDDAEGLGQARLIRCPLEPWRTWFLARGLVVEEPDGGAQFDDIGLVLDAAVAGFGIALMRLALGRAWLDSGRLVRLSAQSAPSPHHYFACWRPGVLERWECASFVDWLRQALQAGD